MEIPLSDDTPAVNGISLAVHANNNIYFFNDDLSKCFRIPSHAQDIYLGKDGCSLVGLNTDLVDPILEVSVRDFQNNLLEKDIYNFENPTHPELSYDFTPSPDFQWVAYKHSSQDYFRSLEESNQTSVKFVRLTRAQTLKVMTLTEHDGAHHANLAWSPDGRYLAFSDFDNNGVTQIYLYEPATGTKSQLSHFVDDAKEYGIKNLTWSTNSAELVFVKVKYHPTGPYLYDTSGGGLGAISLAQSQVRWLIPFAEDLEIRSININYKDEVLTLSRKHVQSQKFAITVRNIDSSSIIKTISPGLLANMKDIAFVIPLDPDLNRFVIDFGPTFVYNDQTNSQSIITSYPFFFEFSVITTPTGALPNLTCGI